MRLIFVSRFFAVWLINEQVCMAACDCGRIDLAQVQDFNNLSVSFVNFKQNKCQQLVHLLINYPYFYPGLY